MDYKEALDVIVTEVKNVVSKMLDAAPYDKTYSGMVISSTDKVCKVRVNGKDRDVKTAGYRNPGEYINLIVPMNNWNNAIIITTLPPTEPQSVYSHVGMIVQTTALDTEAKVKAIYGGLRWQRLDNMFLVGAGSLYDVSTTGGSATTTHTHTVTATGSVDNHILISTEVPSHTHTRGTMEITGSFECGQRNRAQYVSGAFTTGSQVDGWAPSTDQDSAYIDFTASNTWSGETSSFGGDGAHNHGFTGSISTTSSPSDANNLPPYKAVYIWERTQ